MSKSTKLPVVIPERLTNLEPDPFITPCPQWCGIGQHRVMASLEDRSHFGESKFILLELEDMSTFIEDDVLTHEVAQLDVYLVQNYRDAEPKVWLGKADTAGMYMTVAETSALRDTLSVLIDSAEEVAR